MGTEIYVVCVKCKKVHRIGRWEFNLAEAITKSSEAVEEYIVCELSRDLRSKYDHAIKFAEDHSDQGHNVIVGYEA